MTANRARQSFGDKGTSARRRFLRKVGLSGSAALIAIGAVLIALGERVQDAGSVPSDGFDSPVTAMDQTIGPANNSPMLVADPADGRFVALANRLDAPDFGCALQISGDSGKSWTEVNPISALPAGAAKCYAPEIAFDRRGTFYYVFTGLTADGNQPMGSFLVSSTDRARTFSAPHQVLGASNFEVRMAIEIAAGGSARMHLAWLHASAPPPSGGFGSPPNPIMAAYSDDGGATFSTPIQVSDPNRERVAAPALVLGPDNKIYIAYYDLGADDRDYRGLEGPTWDGSWSLVVTSSDDRGTSFGVTTVAEPSVIPAERVMLIFTMPPPSIVANAERVCVGWTDARFGDADVFIRCSAARDQTWSEAQRLNDDPRGNGSRQFLPYLAFAPNGRLDAIFYDRRRNVENIGNDVSYVWSNDGGRSFKGNLRVSSDPSDSRIGPQYAVKSAEGMVEIGSRIGLWSTNGGILAAWADSRNSLKGTTGEDIFVSPVEFSSSGGWQGPTGVTVLGAGLCLGLTGLTLGRERREVEC